MSLMNEANIGLYLTSSISSDCGLSGICSRFSILGQPSRALLLATTLLSGVAEALPESFHAQYSLSGKGMTLGETTYNLSPIPEKKRERFTIHTEPTGLARLLVKKVIDEESIWEWNSGLIRPLQYHYRQSGKREKERARQFDWERGVVTLMDNSEPGALDQLQPNTVDEALFLIALMHDLEQGRESISYRVARRGGWSDYRFTIGERKTVTVPAGEFSTIHISRQKEGKRTFELWSAPALGYLPVQVEYREKDGTLFRLQLKKSSIQPSS